MPSIILASAEGEHALYQNTLSTFGNDDDKHRGSVEISGSDSMFRQWEAAEASNDMWIHVLMARNDSSTNVGGPRTFINIYDVDDNFMAGCRDATDIFESGFIWSTRYSSDGVNDDTQGTFEYTENNQVFADIDIRLRITTTTNPSDTLTVDWYFKQQLRETRILTKSAGWSQPRKLILTSLHTDSDRDTCNYQDVIVTDGIPTVGMELVTLAPAANGFYNVFTNNYTNIDELGYDPNDLIFATAAGQRESWVLQTPTFDASDKIIYGFIAQQIVQTDLGGNVTDFQPFVRIAATDYAGTNLGANNVAPNSYINIWTQNPNTLAPWTEGDFNGLEVGVLTV